MSGRKAIIIGAGPAGLTLASELLARTDIHPIVLEKSESMGGLARTHRYKGNRIDLGGHRFFSKSDRVVNWWLERLPLERTAGGPSTIHYHGASRALDGASSGPLPDTHDAVMLLRKRMSRIYFLRKFFDYPIRFNEDTLRKLGAVRALRIAASYLQSALFPPRQVRNLEQFFISRFGAELYRTFFKSYTEKVWGVPCHKISADWGAQRVKGLSMGTALLHFLKRRLRLKQNGSQKNVQTSLIERFMYPKFGPGQMWEEVAREVRSKGGQILTQMDVRKLRVERNRITAVEAAGAACGTQVFIGDYFFSTMPIQELVKALDTEVPPEVQHISDGLAYRDFIIVGILLNGMRVRDGSGVADKLISDNWIYLQEPDVLASRIQIFNNWSPYLVADPSKVWLGVEYFCNEKDELWRKSDSELTQLATGELDRIGLIDKGELIDSVVLRVPKAYPAYFGSYSRFADLRRYLDTFENLYLIGRNGMHKYNNQDHSMLTAMLAVDNLVEGRTDRSNLWDLNTEMDYQESSDPPRDQQRVPATSKPKAHSAASAGRQPGNGVFVPGGRGNKDEDSAPAAKLSD